MRIVLFMLLMLASVTAAPAVTQKPDPGLERFKTELVDAYSHPDQERIRSLMHPTSLACLQDEPNYERYLLKAESMQALPGDAKISVEAVAASAPLPYYGFKFPVRPSHVVRMKYGKKVSPDGRSSITQIAEKYVGRANDRWYLIMPCPTPEGLGRLRDLGLLE